MYTFTLKAGATIDDCPDAVGRHDVLVHEVRLQTDDQVDHSDGDPRAHQHAPADNATAMLVHPSTSKTAVDPDVQLRRSSRPSLVAGTEFSAIVG